MKPMRTLLVSAAFFLIAVIAATWLYPQLATRMPVHWDIYGRVNGTLPRFWGAALPALMIAVFAGLTLVLPALSPRSFEITPFASVYGLLMLAIQGVLLVLGLAMLLAGAGYAVPMPTTAMLALGALLMVLGNYMGKLRKNFFIGIRTPWTLASDAVWERTHRLGGWLFMLAGLLLVIGTLLGAPAWLALTVIVAAALVPCVYSLWIYRRLENKSDPAP